MAAPARPAAAGIALSPREAEVLGLLREGFSNTEISRLLGITTHTVKLHVAGLLAKLGASDRTQAVARAFDLGLLVASPDKQAP
ncbi:MAG: response regulator transcription factor [Planctomycetia bacterium]